MESSKQGKCQAKTKVCKVCGDVAIGFNYYGEPSCSSCRIFFYRNAAKRESLFCSQGNHCQLDVRTRRNCSKCRIEKCFAIGMKPPATAPLYQQLDPMPRMSPPADSTRPLALVPYESHCIRQICTALAFFPEESSMPLSNRVMTVQGLRTRKPMYMYRMIDYLKRIPLYRTLPYQVKFKLLHDIIGLFSPLRHAFQYCPALNAYILPDDVNIGKTVCIKKTLYYELNSVLEGGEQTNDIIMNLGILMENDTTIRDLLLSIINAEKMWEIIKADYLRYFSAINCYLLQRYLESKLQDSERASEMYRKLMHCTLNELKIVNDHYMRWARQFGLHGSDDAYIELASSSDEES